MKGLLIFFERGIAMYHGKRHAFLLFLLLLAVAVSMTSCSDVRKAYDKGNYRAVVNKLSKVKDPSQTELILKARSYFALGEDEKALESLFLYLMSDPSTQTEEDRSFAVEGFIGLNTSDSLTLMALKAEDGENAQKALYKAYSRAGDTQRARDMLAYLSGQLDFPSYMEIMLSAPSDPEFILETFAAWYATVEESELDAYLDLLNRFSRDVSMDEATAKKCLTLTDVMMGNTYYTSSNTRLSVLYKTKGNILEKLFDKVNARIYWTQALRLNPDDEELKGRLQ